MSPSILTGQVGALSGYLAHLQDHCGVFPAALPKAHFSSEQRDQAVSTVTPPHTPGLLSQSCSSLASQHPRHHKCPTGSNWVAKTTQQQPTQRPFLHKTTFCTTNDCIKKAREAWEFSSKCWDSLGSELLVSDIVYSPLHLDRVNRSSIQVLWPTFKVTAMCSQTHCTNPFQLQTKEASKINRTLLNTLDLPT